MMRWGVEVGAALQTEELEYGKVWSREKWSV